MKDEKVEQFVRCFSADEHRIYRYVYAMVPNADDARDIVQETSVALWRKFDEYDPSQPFAGWACRFAYYEALKFRKQRRHATSYLSDETVAAFAEEYVAQSEELENRRKALDECLTKLPDKSRALLEERYSAGHSVQEIARRSGRSVNTLYKTMEQIRRLLLACITRSLAAGGSA